MNRQGLPALVRADCEHITAGQKRPDRRFGNVSLKRRERRLHEQVIAYNGPLKPKPFP
jgi:hypothetical protein